MVMRIALTIRGPYVGVIMIYVIFVFWAALTISILGKTSAAEPTTNLTNIFVQF